MSEKTSKSSFVKDINMAIKHHTMISSSEIPLQVHLKLIPLHSCFRDVFLVRNRQFLFNFLK